MLVVFTLCVVVTLGHTFFNTLGNSLVKVHHPQICRLFSITCSAE